MFDVMVAFYFWTTVGVVGPFSSDAQCEKVRQQVARLNNQPVSMCWYGPALALARPQKP